MRPRKPLLVGLTLAGALAAWPSVSRAQDPLIPLGTDQIVCNFNGTAIACPGYVWFMAVGKLSTPALAPVTIYLQNQHIQFTAGNVNYDLQVPDGATTFDPIAGSATSTFTGASAWDTTVPLSASGNQFYAAVAWPVPCAGGLPGSIHDVAWSASFFASKPGATIQWTWSAAAYSSFSTSYNTLGVKASDSNQFPPYANSHHAGTPENFTGFVVGGATGGGGSNFTGSLCSTHSVPNIPTAIQGSTWGRMKTLYR